MAEEIKQSGQVGRVLPVNPARDGEARKRRQPRKSPDARPRQKRPGDGTHQVDEYV